MKLKNTVALLLAMLLMMSTFITAYATEGEGAGATPTTTAMLHNASTLGIGLLSTKKLL